MMVAAESAKSHSSADNKRSSTPICAKIIATLRPIALSILIMSGQVMITSQAFADIIADPNAPANQRPIINETANGLPLVNIQTPSAAGVSRNTYKQFDVKSQGAILNNSNTNVQTQLGGWVQGNPYLAGGTAKVILNEVNSQNPSLLNGYIEVAGSRAQVVIANPAGISCDGCGFINANRATLTTGTSIMNNGNLLGYRVGGGNISFLGNGLDTSQVNFTDVIARAVEVNAGIWANVLNITTGTNQVNIDSNGNQASVTPITPNAGSAPPAFAIDVAALGGMYAGKIHMIGTEAGLGVRNAGAIGASVGAVSITADGLLQNSGTISAKTNVQLDVTGLESDGRVTADGDITINLASDYIHTGELQAGGNLDLQTSGDITNQSTILASQSLNLSANNINNTVSGEIVGFDTQMTAADTLTNRGLIDGVDTLINADSLISTQTGSIFGDHLAIQVAHLGNDAGAVIAARNRLDIGAATIENRTDGLIFSAGDLSIGGSLDGTNEATGSADSLINDGSTIEALGNATLAVTDLQNLNADLVTQVVQTGTSSFDRFTARGRSDILESGDYPAFRIGDVGVEWRYGSTYGLSYNFREYTRYLGTRRFYETQVVSSTPGQISSDGDMTIIGAVLNSDSQIIAGGNLDVSGASVQNLNSTGQSITSYNGTAYYYDWDGNDNDYDVDVIGPYNPANTVVTYNLSTSRLEGSTAPAGSGTTVTSAAVPIVSGSLFQPNPDVAADYLIETNPRFANYRTWLSSDYMMQQLAFDPATTQKRLGDGFYEQRLIREQVAQLAGRRFLEGHASDEAQYQALMASALTHYESLQLIPGVALSPAQIAQLTSDIVWLVEQTVTLPDGTVTQALVPQVYVRLQAGDLQPTTGMMTGNTVTMNLSGDVANQGTIAGREFLALNAENINNLGGQIVADTTLLNANNDINNVGGQVIAKDAMLLEAGNDINLRSTTQSSKSREGASSFSRTNIDRVAGLYMSNPDAILVANAGNDINLMAASIVNSGAGGQTVINAGQDINLSTVTIAEQNSSIRNAKNYVKHGGTQEIGSVIETDGDIAFIAGNDFNAKAASVTSEAGAINVTATKDIIITEGRETSNFDTARKVKRSSTFSSKTKTQRDVFKSDNSVSSNLSADTVTLQAGNDLKIRGSNVVSDNGTTLIAGDNVNITAAKNTAYELHERKTKTSGLSTSGATITLGTSALNTKQTSNSVNHTGSTVGSVEGDVNIMAGKTYTQKASDVLAPQGDIDITAQRVDITVAQNTSQTVQETKFKQSGLTLAISNPVISAIQTAQQMSDAASQTSDGRMQALAAATTALAAKNAYDAVQTAQAKPPTGDAATDAANQVGGINISLSIGTSKSSSKTTQTSTSAQSSQVVAGGDINITATGAGKDSDINVVGSQVKADNNITLKAEDQINLIAAKNTETLNSKNKNSSASIGASVGTSGFAITASASKGKGKANGNDVTWTETTVEAGNKVTLESGTDTNLTGAQVRGDQVVADVGTSGNGNLNIQSLQDTSTYDSKQKSAGVSVSVPIGAGAYGGSISSSKTKIESDYASVNEQAGIFAGDEGFQLSVNGNTNLKGAVIATTEQAIADNKNSLITETLTVSNIQNKAEYEAKGSSAAIGYGSQGGLPQLSGAGIGSDSDKASSTTVSAISEGTVSITDNEAQENLTDKDGATTVALLNRDVHVNEQGKAVDSQGNSTANTITPIFDAEKVAKEIEAQVKITQAFNQEAPRALATFALSKTQPYQDAKDYELITSRADNGILLSEYELSRLDMLNASGMTMEAAQAILNDPQAKSDYESWNGNGDYLKAANIIIAAIGGGSSGLTTALTKESLSWAANQMREHMKKDSEKFAGLCVSENDCINNASGTSAGVYGDNLKEAGGRIVLADWCEKGGSGACQSDSNTESTYKENPDGTVIFSPKDEYGNSLTISQFLERHQELRSTLGGVQGSDGQMELLGFQFEYIAGSFWDKLAEVYAGTHDTFNSIIWYDKLGNGKNLNKTLLGTIGDITNITNVVLATPFALSVLLPPEVWNTVFNSIKN